MKNEGGERERDWDFFLWASSITRNLKYFNAHVWNGRPICFTTCESRSGFPPFFLGSHCFLQILTSNSDVIKILKGTTDCLGWCAISLPWRRTKKYYAHSSPSGHYLKVCSLQRSVEHFLKKAWEHLLCDSKVDSNLRGVCLPAQGY